MMAMTTTSALPWMLDGGTIGPVGRTFISGRFGCCTPLLRSVGEAGLLINIETPLGQNHAARFDLVHESQVVGRDHHGRTETVELEKQTQ